MNKTLSLTAVALAFMASSAVNAAVIQTIGSGSAVTTANASANFESQNSLFDRPYIEDGISFTSSNLSTNNNGCGYAGCAGHVGFVGFTGNYLYGVTTDGVNGAFTISTTNGNVFSGLEFVVGTGFGLSNMTVSWSALLNGSVVSNGVVGLAVGSVIGFAGSFDSLVYTSTDFDYPAPALDTVRAQYTGVTQTPVPAAAWLFASALPLVGFGRRKQNVNA